MFAFRYPAILLLICVVCGTIAGKLCAFPPTWLWICAIIALLILAILAAGRKRQTIVYPLMFIFFAIAMLRAMAVYTVPPENDIGRHMVSPDRTRFFGAIAEWPILKRHKTQLICAVDSIVRNDTCFVTSGRMLVTIRRETTQFAAGDKIMFEGRPYFPKPSVYGGRFDYPGYLANKAIRGCVTITDPVRIAIQTSHHSYFNEMVLFLRRWIVDGFAANMRDTPAALASGFLIGETHNIPEDVYTAFRRTGTLHLLAVSGSNVALVLGVVLFLFRFVPVNRWLRLFLLLAVIVLFTHISYCQPSVVRAAVMASLVLIARAVYRRADLNNIIALAAAGIVYYDATQLFDIGFQLSFAVTWALIIFLPACNQLFHRIKVSAMKRYTLLIILSSAIASLVSAPISAYYFGEISLVTVFSNLVVVPLVSLAVVGIVIFLAVYLAWPALAIAPAMLLDRLLQLIMVIVQWFGQWQFSVMTIGRFPMIYTLLLLSLIATIPFLMKSKTLRWMAATIAGILLLVMGYRTVFGEPQPYAEIYNNSLSQTIIYRGDKTVLLYRQLRDKKDDDFSRFVLPLLKERNIKSDILVFIEPDYRVWNRMEMLEATDACLCYKPMPEEYDSPGVHIWVREEAAEEIEQWMASNMQIGKELIRFAPEDGRELSIITNVMSNNHLDIDSTNSAIVLFLSTARDIEQYLTGYYPVRGIVLTERPLVGYKMLTDNALYVDPEFWEEALEPGNRRLLYNAAVD